MHRIWCCSGARRNALEQSPTFSREVHALAELRQPGDLLYCIPVFSPFLASFRRPSRRRSSPLPSLFLPHLHPWISDSLSLRLLRHSSLAPSPSSLVSIHGLRPFCLFVLLVVLLFFFSLPLSLSSINSPRFQLLLVPRSEPPPPLLL